MLDGARGFASFSVDDIAAAREFYGRVLGLPVEDDPMGILRVALPGGGAAIIYPKEDHAPATHTVLMFAVPDPGAGARALAAAGVAPLRYAAFGDPDVDGVYRGEGEGHPDIVWFADPAGNVLSLVSA